MPKHAATKRYLAINGTAISDHCSQIDFVDQTDTVEVTGFTANSYKEYVPGMSDATVTAQIFADFDASQVHALLQPLYANRSTFTLKIAEDQSIAFSATNPTVTMTARLYEYSPFAGAVGAAASFQATFHNAGTAGPQWGTS